MIAQQITEYVYQDYLPAQFYSQYLKQAKARVDGRQASSHRTIRISITNNAVTVARGSTIVIAQIRTSVQTVTYSPLTESYGKPLLCVTVQTLNQGSKFERNAARATQKYVEDFVDWKEIEAQLVGQTAQGKDQLFAHTGEVSIKIADADGSVDETALLAMQFLLWTAQFSKIGAEGVFQLSLSQFWFPIKYCEILDQVLVDPLASQERASNFELTLLKDLKKKGGELLKVQRVHRETQAETLPPQVVSGIQKLYMTQVSKLPFDISEVQSRSNNIGEPQTIIISGL